MNGTLVHNFGSSLSALMMMMLNGAAGIHTAADDRLVYCAVRVLVRIHMVRIRNCRYSQQQDARGYSRVIEAVWNPLQY